MNTHHQRDHQSEEAKAARAAQRAAIQKNMQQAVSNLLAEIKAGKTENLLNYLKFAAKFTQILPKLVTSCSGGLMRGGANG